MPATFTDAEVAKSEKRRASVPAAGAPVRSELHSFLEELLTDQQKLQTPVARFAEQHSSLVARHSPLHSELIPLTAPDPGEQYAFEVDLDSCSGCKACVAGCHSLNGLDEDETWRDVGLVLGGDAASHEGGFQQTITSACHHCADPACANGCPVLAYEKDPVTGIVRHLDDQCIGCSYCILKCPYDVPKFNARLGIVRKCDMCHGRLAAGEAPACVQACPTHAIRITKVSVAPARNGNTPVVAHSLGDKSVAAPAFLPVFPHPGYTQPTTRYVSKRPLPVTLRAADAAALRPQPAHWPLALMLVLTQASVGFTIAETLVTHWMPSLSVLTSPDGVNHWLTRWSGSGASLVLALAWAAAAAGLAASVAHLGRPLRAWRVFLGWRKSWLSREAMLLGSYFAMLSAALLIHTPALLAATVATGVPAVGCSIMIYVDTRRRFWRFAPSTWRMGGTVAVAALALLSQPAAAVALGVKLAGEGVSLRGNGVSARLQRGPLRRIVLARLALGAAAAALFAAQLSLVALGVWLLGEFAERHLYFRAVDAPKMPGVAAP